MKTGKKDKLRNEVYLIEPIYPIDAQKKPKIFEEIEAHML